MKIREKARFSGLLFILTAILAVACNSSEGKKEKAAALPYQYPKDPIWRGIPMQADHELYIENQLASPMDSIIRRIEKMAGFSYPHGVQESELTAIFAQIQKQQTLNVQTLRYLGIPLQKDAREKLKYLNLSGRNLTGIPAELAVLKALTDLQISDNNIRHLGALLFCRSLKRIDLSSNIIDHVPPEIVYMNNLEELNLRDNRLTSLPGNFAQLRNLKVLDISNVHKSLSRSYNKFQYVPPVVCHLPNLEKLFLEKLPINQIPVNIVYLKKLKLLSISGCSGVNIYNALRILSQMTELQVLDISFTGCTRIPNEIVHLKNLKVLIWQEEGNYNTTEIERLRALMPNTKIYSGRDARPFLRGNSLNTIINGH